MKQISTILVFSLFLVLSSCNNKPAGTEDKTTTDTVATVTTPEEPAFQPFQIMIAVFKVKNFETWHTSFDSRDTARKAADLIDYHIARGLEDSNQVIVFEKVGNLQKAKDFMASPAQKAAMKGAGIIGAPTVMFDDVVFNTDKPIEYKDRIMVTHRVKDYNTFLQVFNAEGDSARLANGLIHRATGRDVNDANNVGLVFAVTDMAKAKAQLASPELKKIMTDAGVEGKPTFYFYHLVK